VVADANSEQPAGDLFGARARSAGEILGMVVTADPGHENGEDYCAEEESSNGNYRNGGHHRVTLFPCCCLAAWMEWLRPRVLLSPISRPRLWVLAQQVTGITSFYGAEIIVLELISAQYCVTQGQ
jgi:hypothetical protein